MQQKSEVRSQKSERRHGFTLIELLLVLLILAVLAAVVVPKFTGKTEKANIDAARAQISMFETAIELFEHENGRLPTTEEGLRALVERPPGLDKWSGYLTKNTIPNDPWGSPFIYHQPGSHNSNSFDLYSFGPDKREGNDDITNW